MRQGSGIMSSATINRPTGAMPAGVRSTRFGDFTTPAGRTANTDDKTSQSSNLSQTFGNNWEASGGIWGNPIGSGLPNGKRDVSNTREDNPFEGVTSGSGQLAPSSVADPWGASRPWAMNTNSPTKSSSGTTSPVRLRGSNSGAGILDVEKTPYLPIGQVSMGNLSSSRKSNLDPSSGTFKYPSYQKPSSFGSVDDKENVLQNSYGGSYGIGPGSRDRSQPPSRHSNNSASTSISGLGNGYAFGHTPSSSVAHVQRPSISGRTPSFPTMSNSRFEANDQLQNLESLEGMSGTQEQLISNYISQHNTPLPFVWNNTSSSVKGSNFFADGYSENSFTDQVNLSKGRLSERSTSPAGDYRRQHSSPKYYQVASTPSNESEYVRRVRSVNISEVERGIQRLQFTPQQFYPQPVMFNGQYAPSYNQHLYDYPQNAYRTNGQYGYQQMPMPPYTSSLAPPRGPARDQDVGHGVRSLLLEEFRANQKSSSKRYDLKDIYNHIVEFSGDQHGSRFIQQKLETANSDEKDQVFREIQPNALQLMTDVFGNYVVQKMFEHGNQVQKKVLAEIMKNHVNELSLQMYGCRVVQKALEHVLADQQAELVRELQPEVLKCVQDQNGNHVIQKAIERVPTEHIQFIIEAFRGQVHSLATHPYGCRVIQRMLEYCSEEDQASVLEELHACAQMLITDQYGNYVVQHIIAHGKAENRDKLIKSVTIQLHTFAKHKFASNVVEKSIQFGTEDQRRAIVAMVTNLHSDGTSPLQLMMKDQFGNYVVQKLLAQLKGEERERFVEDIKPQLTALKKYNYSKQIASIEKLIYAGRQPSPPHVSYNKTASPEAPKTSPLEINSMVPTPLLTMEQNSPQSSSLPSTNVSTVDDAAVELIGMEKTELLNQEVQIEVV